MQPETYEKVSDHISRETRAWVVSDGKIGDEVQCFGILEALGLAPERRLIAPRKIFAIAMPWGPIDPREARGRRASPFAGAWPDIVVAAGRRSVPYLRYLKRQSAGTIFTVFVKDPYCRNNGADLIWVPTHDRRRGDAVIATLTPANRLPEHVIERARAEPDSRLTRLPRPRVAIILGGTSTHHGFGHKEERDLAEIASALSRDGMSVMVTPSRRTPRGLLVAIEAALGETDPTGSRSFVWHGDGENPYVAMLANAEKIIVTGDSVNMLGESLVTGAPVHVYEPSGGHRKITAYVDALVALGALRRWQGRLENWTYAPINATPEIAAEVARRYHEFRGTGRMSP